MASSTPSATPDQSEAHRVTAAASKTFKHVVSVKLDDSNYLQWKQQVEGVLRGTKLVKYVVSPQIPPVFLKILCYVRGFYLPFRHRCSRDSFIFAILGRFGKKFITTASRKCEHDLVNSDRSFVQSPKVRVQFLSLLFLYMRM
jgi:hypothetical protein